MLVYQKAMFDRYYCMSFCPLNSLLKCFEKFNFCIIYNGAQKPKGYVGFKKPCSTAGFNVILTSLNYVHFYASYC